MKLEEFRELTKGLPGDANLSYALGAAAGAAWAEDSAEPSQPRRFADSRASISAWPSWDSGNEFSAMESLFLAAIAPGDDATAEEAYEDDEFCAGFADAAIGVFEW